MNFWNLFTHCWQITFHQTIVLSEKEILYSWLENRSSINFIAFNYSLIIAKYHIFTSSICVGSLDFDSFLLCLKDKLCIICSLAVKSKELDQFKETWLFCFSVVSGLCVCMCIASTNVMITVIQSLCNHLVPEFHLSKVKVNSVTIL